MFRRWPGSAKLILKVGIYGQPFTEGWHRPLANGGARMEAQGAKLRWGNRFAFASGPEYHEFDRACRCIKVRPAA